MKFSFVAVCTASLLSITNATTGVWKLIESQKWGDWFPSNVDVDTYIQNDASKQNKYTIINAHTPCEFADSNGDILFRIHFKNDVDASNPNGEYVTLYKKDWKQKSWPSETDIVGSNSANGQEEADECYGNIFYGLARSDNVGVAAYDGNGAKACWFKPLGVMQSGGYPGFPVLRSGWTTSTAKYTQLFVCEGGNDCDDSSSFDCGLDPAGVPQACDTWVSDVPPMIQPPQQWLYAVVAVVAVLLLLNIVVMTYSMCARTKPKQRAQYKVVEMTDTE